VFVQPILNYFTGYVKIKVEGLFLERFINICVSKKILLMDIKREKSTIMYANVGIADYKKLKQVARKTKSKIKIQRKKGLPFTIKKYRKRKIFGILFVVILALLIVSSNYIWNIEISGNVKITNQEILQSLEGSGLKVGLSKNDIDINAVISKIRLDREDIAWIGITVKGTNAIVKIKEAAKAPEVIDENKFCNIVANKTGMITKINVQNGTANVKVGDIVEEGDILVNGYLEGKYTGTRYVHGAATVEAKIWYTKKEKAMLKQQIPVQTGNEEKKYSIKFKKNQINLFKTLSKFEKYDTINENKKIILFSNFYLPIEVVKITNKEYVLQDVTYTNEEQTQILTEKLKKELLEEIGEQKNIVNVNVNTYSQDETVEVEVTYEVLENIGVEQEMNI
jgi:similar to stage IV sporulation protein